jgi:hypothetical protein
VQSYALVFRCGWRLLSYARSYVAGDSRSLERGLWPLAFIRLVLAACTVDLHQVSPPRGRLISARLTPADSQGGIPLSVVGTLRKRGDFFWLRLTFQRGMFAGFGGILGEVPLYGTSTRAQRMALMENGEQLQNPTHIVS